MYPSSSNRKMTREEHEQQIGRLVGRQAYAGNQRKVSFDVEGQTFILD